MKQRHSKQTIIPPEGGWKPHTVYHVEASFGPNNPVHGYLFYSGFLNGPKQTPGGYNEFYGCDGLTTIVEVYYMKVLSAVITTATIDNVPNKHKMVHNLPLPLPLP